MIKRLVVIDDDVCEQGRILIETCTGDVSLIFRRGVCQQIYKFPQKPWREEARDRDALRSGTNVDPPLVFVYISNPRDASYAHSPSQGMNVPSLLILH